MSTVPPVSATPPDPLPWEARQSRGLVPAFFDTLGLFFSRPSEAWARTRERGDLTSPLLFGTVVSWLTFVVHSVLTRLIAFPVILPGEFGRRFGAMEGYGRVGLFFSVLFSPIFIVCALFVGAALLHVCCLITGALSNSASGFEGSFRVVAYSQVSSLAGMIPVVGGFISIVWWIVLAVLGLQRLHRTTQGKAIAAVLIPVVLCCAGILVMAAVGAAFLFHRAR